MALVTCPDCGRSVSSLAFACPQCARPLAPIEAAPSSAAGEAPQATTVPASPVGGDATTQPVLTAWLGDLRKARELPPRTKTCKRCDADVTLDTFRRKDGDSYICADCVYEEDERREARKGVLSRIMIALSLFLVLGMLTVAAIQLGPVLFAPRTVRK